MDVKFLLKVKTMQDFHCFMSNITTWLLTLLFPRFPNDFPHVRKEREVVIMTKKFARKVLANGIVDTREYRYVVDWHRECIKRIRLEDLDTTNAISGWEVVYKCDK